MNFWHNKNVLITGINGFVASHLAKNLIGKGSNVFGLIKNTSVYDVLNLKEKISITFGDVTDYQTIRSIINKKEINVVFHLAAVSTVRICSRDPLVAFKTNVEGTWNILEACRGVKTIESIVIASTDKCYGIPERLPYKESDNLNGLASYDATKVCADIIARSYSYNYDMPVIVTRGCNIYGPGDFNLSRIIPNTIRRMISGKPAILWKDSAEMVREFIYIDDVVNAYLILAEKAEIKKGNAYNVGTGDYISILSFVKKLYTYTEYKPEVEIKERESEFKEIPEQYLDSTKIKKDFNWIPLISLEEGLKRTIEWYLNFFKEKEK